MFRGHREDGFTEFLRDNSWHLFNTILVLVLLAAVSILWADDGKNETVTVSDEEDIDAQLKYLELETQKYEYLLIQQQWVDDQFERSCLIFDRFYDCDAEKIDEVSTGYIVNNKMASLLEVCRMKVYDPSFSKENCAKLCPTC
ncbi:MAG: hypothetical protein ACP5E4_03085 [Candidatus Aenigmatarchaeota archaeon]